MPNFRLISSKTCPYVQRSVMTLREKGIPSRLVASDHYPLPLSGQKFIMDFLDFPKRTRWTIRIDIVPIGLRQNSLNELLRRLDALEWLAT